MLELVSDGLLSRAIWLLQWKAQYESFSQTPMGKALVFGFVFYLFYTGFVFRIINFLLLIWWLAPIVLLPLSGYINKKVRKGLERPYMLIHLKTPGYRQSQT